MTWSAAFRPPNLQPDEASRYPSVTHGVGARVAGVFPPPEVGLLYVEPKDMVVIVDDVTGNLTNHSTRFGGLAGSASKHELVVSKAWECVDHTTGVSLKIPPLRRPVTDSNEDAPRREYRDDRMDTWAPVGPNGRQICHNVLFP